MFQNSDKNQLRSLQDKKARLMRADHSAALHASQASVVSVDDALKEEMHQYSSVRQIEIDYCTLKWWKDHVAKSS